MTKRTGMKKRYQTRRRLLLAVCLPLWAVALSGCVNEDWTDCNLPTIRITAPLFAGHDPIAPTDVRQVTAYVFDDAGKALLEVIPSRLGAVHTLNHPGRGRLYVMAVANCLDRVSVTDMKPGHRLSAASVDLQPLASDGAFYDTSDDLMWGEAVVANHTAGAAEHVDLPIRRVVAGIFIRVRGLANKTSASLDDVYVAMGTQYNTFSFRGEPGWTGMKAAGDVMHRPVSGRNPADRSVIEAPDPAGAEPSFSVLSTDAGREVSISVGDPSGTIATVTHQADDNGVMHPLMAKNGMLNIFELTFAADGSVGVKVEQARWGERPPIDKEF